MRTVAIIVLVAGCAAAPANDPSAKVAAPAVRAPRASSPVTPIEAAAAATSVVTPADAPDGGSEVAATDEPEPELGPDACGHAPKLDHRARLGASGVRKRGARGDEPFGFFAVRTAVPAPDPSSPIELRVDAPSRAVPGKPLGLKLTVTNRSQKPITLGLAVDGSLEHWRSPFVDLYARDEASGRVYRYDFYGGRCGNVSTRTKSDYVKLAAGEAREPAFGEWANHVQHAGIAVAGRYSLWVVYTSCQGSDQGLALRLSGASRLPKPYLGVVASAPVVVEVGP